MKKKKIIKYQEKEIKNLEKEIKQEKEAHKETYKGFLTLEAENEELKDEIEKLKSNGNK